MLRTHHIVVVVGAMAAVGCPKKEQEEAERRTERSEPSVPLSAAPVEPAVMSATDFCRLVYEAPVRALEGKCSEAEKITKAFGAIGGKARERVQQCWQMLATDVQERRLTLPTSTAKRCATALAARPWKHALFSMAVTELSECRNLTIGTQGAGKPCRASAGCMPGYFCAGSKPGADGVCTKKVAAGERCEAPPFVLLSEIDAGCDTGFFCDHGLSGVAAIDAPGGDTRYAQNDPSPVPGATGKVKSGKPKVTGGLDADVIRRIVRAHFAAIRTCYEDGLRSNPTLSGVVYVRFVIGRDGSVSTATSDSTDITDQGVLDCISRAFYAFTFPQPEGGIVSVKYPIKLVPGDGTTTPTYSASNQCVAFRKSGDPCQQNRECETGLVCREAKCDKPAAATDRCSASSECAEGLYCGTKPAASEPTPAPDAGAGGGDSDEESAPAERACMTPKAAGESCAEHEECAGACIDGTCKAFCGG
jgi:hypothetical protein